MMKETKCFLIVAGGFALGCCFVLPTLFELAVWWARYLSYRLGL